MTIVLFTVGFAGGFVLGWLVKDKFLIALAVAESFVKILEAKAAALKSGR